MSGTMEQGWINGATYGAGTASATVKAAAGKVYGLQVHFNATLGSIELRDGGASGTIRFKQTFQVITAGDGQMEVDLHGLSFGTDIYIAMTNHQRVNIQYA